MNLILEHMNTFIMNLTLEHINTLIACLNLIATIVLSISGYKLTKKLTDRTSKEQKNLTKEQRVQERRDTITISLKNDFEQIWLYSSKLFYQFGKIQDNFQTNKIKITDEDIEWKNFILKFEAVEAELEEYIRKVNFTCTVNKGYIPDIVSESIEKMNGYLQVVSDNAFEIRISIKDEEICEYRVLAGQGITFSEKIFELAETIVTQLNTEYYS